MIVSIVNRTQIVDADATRLHKNMATDFAELANWHTTNTNWFVDSLTMLNFTDNNSNQIQLSKGYCFVKFVKDSRIGWARCEIVNDISEIISGIDWTYYLTIELNQLKLNSWTWNIDWSDVFSLKLTNAPVNPNLSLREITKLWNAISAIDLREMRSMKIESLEAETISVETINADVVNWNTWSFATVNWQTGSFDTINLWWLDLWNMIDTIEWNEWTLSYYTIWENWVKWQVVFLESTPTQANSTVSQQFWRTVNDRRAEFPFYWSWLWGSTAKVNLSKQWAPTQNVKLRIETDNAWTPSWLQAPWTIESFLLPASIWAMSEETFNLWWTDIVENTWIVYDTNLIKTGISWYKIYCVENTIITKINKDNGSSATTAYIYNSAMMQVATAPFVWNIATFSYQVLATWNYYVFAWVASWSYWEQFKASITLPVNWNFLNFTSGAYIGGEITEWWYSPNTLMWASQSGWLIFVANKDILLKKVTVSSSLPVWEQKRVRLWKWNAETWQFITSINTTLNEVDFTSKWIKLLAWETYTLWVSVSFTTQLVYRDNGGWLANFTNIDINFWWYANGSSYIHNYTFPVQIVSIESSDYAETTNWYNLASVEVADQVTLVKNQKYRAILYQGTYGAETIDNTSYYNIWHQAVHTATRPLSLYNGIIHTPDPLKFSYFNSSIATQAICSISDYIYTNKRKIIWVLMDNFNAWEICVVNTYHWKNQINLTPLQSARLSETVAWLIVWIWAGTVVWTADGETSFYITKIF